MLSEDIKTCVYAHSIQNINNYKLMPGKATA